MFAHRALPLVRSFRRTQALSASSLCRNFVGKSRPLLGHKVAVIQDQQIPKEQAIQAIADKGFEVLWAADQPSDAWAIVTVTTPVTKEVLDKHPNCKLVAVSFTGFNHVDEAECKKRGISIVNVPAYSTDSVAELSVGLALAVLREIPGGMQTLQAGGWAHSAGGEEIADKTVGIVGLGDIGVRTAEIFKAFRPKELIGFSRKEKPAFTALGGKHYSLEEVFEKADIVSVHVAMNAQTKHIISRSLMEKLKPDAVLINVARGGVIDQAAMCELLTQKRFRAGLDVFEVEPMPKDENILKVPQEQVVLTPHVAYKTKEALARRIGITASNLRAFADGSPINCVFSP
jgi:D-3-phosphoglycerate dehydrogenase